MFLMHKGNFMHDLDRKNAPYKGKRRSWQGGHFFDSKQLFYCV